VVRKINDACEGCVFLGLLTVGRAVKILEIDDLLCASIFAGGFGLVDRMFFRC
jgi:hypothetical protein